MVKALRTLLMASFLIALPSQLVIVVEDPGNYPYILAAKRQAAVVEKAMRYHGTTQAYSDGTTWYFRNPEGKVCRLFTASFKPDASSSGKAS